MPSKPKPEKPDQQKPAKPPVRTRASRPVVDEVKIEKLTTDPDGESVVNVFGPSLDKHLVTVTHLQSEDHVWGGRLSAVTGGGPEDWTAKVKFPGARERKKKPDADVSVTVINPTTGLPSKPKKLEKVPIE